MAESWRPLRAAGAVVALAVLTGGLPAVLYAAGGSPVPHGAPSWQQVLAGLVRPESPALFLAVIRAVSWVAWAAFTACVLAQALALARGRQPRRLPGTGPLQRLATVLVSTAVLGAAAAPASARAAPPRPARVTAAAPLRPGPPAAAALVPVRSAGYRVRPGDNLWDIAAVHLGDGEAWHQIWDLNKGRPQPGGDTLTRPDLIQPGWILRLPHPAARPPSPRPAPGPPRAPSPPPAPAPAPPAQHPAGGGHHARQCAGAGISLPSGGLAGVALTLAVTAALALGAVHRRRRYRPGRDFTSRLGPAVPPAAPAIAALRRAAAPPPGDDAGPGDDPAGSDPYGPVPGEIPPRPAAADAPLPGHPETGSHLGPPHLAGTAQPAGLPVLASPPGLPPGRPDTAARAVAAWPAAPGEVALGIRDGREVSADLPALGGLGLAGPGAAAAARAILAALLSRALPGSPHGPAEVIMTTGAAEALLPGYHCGAALPGLTVAASLDAALDRAEEIIVRRARMTATGDDEDEEGGPAALPPAVLITVPGPPPSGRLRAVLQAGRGTGVAGILLGGWAAGTTCHVTADGVLASDDPDLDGTRLFHLAATDTAAILAVLRDACGPPGDPAPAPIPPAPPDAAREPVTAAPAGPPRDPQGGTGEGAGRVPVPGGRLIRVEVLGPLRITAAGTEVRGGLRKARELAAYLAVHPQGATSDAITEALWPGSPHGAAQRALALRRLRDLLRSAAGVTEPLLVLLAAGRYRLDPSLVSTDYADFQAALDDARTAPGDQGRLAACRRAAGLYRGPLADGAGYDWAEPLAETARRRALDACARIAQILGPGHPDEALAALETAVSHDPYNEWAYQAIMRIQAGAGRPDAVRRTLSLLEARLADLGVTPGAQTRELAAALLGPPAASTAAGPAAGPRPPR